MIKVKGNGLRLTLFYDKGRKKRREQGDKLQPSAPLPVFLTNPNRTLGV